MLEEGTKRKKEKCFGANIYDLLGNHFFMKEFIGEFAGNKIDGFIDMINKATKKTEARRDLLMVKCDVERISDDLIRQKLLERIDFLMTNFDEQ